jgi:hypothetical protein
MPFSLEQFASRRPFLFHCTARENLRGLQQTGQLRSAAALLAAAGRADLLRQRRTASETVTVHGIRTVLCDQAKLTLANVALEGELTADDLVELLNRRVFFWPGTADGPIDYGRRHLARYAAESPLVLRMPTTALHEANPGMVPTFCAYNSGSPRCSGGRPSPRGPASFLRASDFARGIGDVVEFTVEGQVRLPHETEISDTYDGPWTRLSAVSRAPRESSSWSEHEP